MLHHVGPGPREQVERLGREISFGHRPVEPRLRGRLVTSREQLPGLRAIGRAEAFGSSRDFVPRVKIAARAAKHPISFLHDLGSNAWSMEDHGDDRSGALGEFQRSSADFYQSSPSSRKSGRICAQNDVTRSSSF